MKSQFTKKRAQETPGAIRISELSKSKIEMAVSMIKSAIKIGFAPKYVLADSWFITDDFIKQVGGLKSKTEGQCHVIGLMKANRIVVFNGRNVKAELLPVMKHKKVQKNRKFKCCYIALNVDYKGSELKIFFVKMKGQTSWKMLITTDKTLSFSKAMKYYQIRWSIEVFFKDAKQNLYLGKCQSNDFDAHIASISICFMNYTLLALSKRFESYETLGQMFREIKDQLLEDTLIIKLWNFFIEVFTNLLADLGVDWETFMEKFIQTDDLNEKLKNIFNFLFITNRKDNILAA